MKITFSFLFLSIAIVVTGCSGKKTTIDPETGEVIEYVDSASIKYPEGEAVYNRTCIACHQAEGEGVAGAFPPLAQSDYLLADKNRAIYQVIHGSSGEMVVNGQTYNTIMPPQELTDQEVMDVINYVLNAWGNKGGEVTMEDVKAQK